MSDDITVYIKDNKIHRSKTTAITNCMLVRSNSLMPLWIIYTEVQYISSTVFYIAYNNNF